MGDDDDDAHIKPEEKGATPQPEEKKDDVDVTMNGAAAQGQDSNINVANTAEDDAEMEQQDEQRDAAAAPTPASASTSKVNGIGMWRSWTRSFNTPVLALMDLFDNAVDAALLVKRADGKVEFSSDLPIQNPEDPVTAKLIYRDDAECPRPAICVHADKFGAAGASGTAKHGRGFVLMNSCLNKIPPLQQVLEVYRSSKDNPHSIGENGVGIKQACSNLSDLSFIIKKSGDTLGLGVLCKDLQKTDGCVLPSHEFPMNGDIEKVEDRIEEWHKQLIGLGRKFPKTFGVAFAQYGDGSLDQGIDQLISHFREISVGTSNNRRWTRYPHVFCVVLHELRHGTDAVSRAIESATSEENDDVDNQRARTAALLDSLAEALPKTYLHLSVPETRLLVTVRHKTVPFQYWERRLVELTKFNVFVDKETVWSESASWKMIAAGESEEEVLKLVDDSNDNPSLSSAGAGPPTEDDKPKRTPGATTAMRIFCGFNPKPVGDKSLDHLNLYVYSRQSGRLIKHTVDARGELGLTNGGADFSQGLTVLLDDFRGTLPLNPTKQDLAFGLESHGQVHRNNVTAWLSGVVHMYWFFHKDRMKGSKAELTAHVLAQQERVASLSTTAPHALPTLSSGDFSKFATLKFRNFRDRIQCNAADRQASGYELGPQTIIPLIPGDGDFRALVPTAKKRGRKKSVTPPPKSKKMQARKMAGASMGKLRIHDEDDDSDEDFGGSVRKRKRNTNSYNEDGINLDDDFFQRYSSSPDQDRKLASQQAEMDKLYNTIQLLTDREQAAQVKVTKLETKLAESNEETVTAEEECMKLERQVRQQQEEIERLKESNTNGNGAASLPASDSELSKKVVKLERKCRILSQESDSRAGEIADLQQMIQRKDEEIQSLKQELLAEE